MRNKLLTGRPPLMSKAHHRERLIRRRRGLADARFVAMGAIVGGGIMLLAAGA